MDTAYGYGSFITPKIASHKVQEAPCILGTTETFGDIMGTEPAMPRFPHKK